MTSLEREWRRLARSDPDGALMDLWARIAPHPFIDRKLWRDSDPDAQLDSLRTALAPWGTPIGTRIRWRPFEHDSDCSGELLAQPLRAACEILSGRTMDLVVLDRARHLERDVYETALARFPERALLAGSLAHAALVDHVFRAASLPESSNSVTALRELWSAGYVLAAIGTSGATIEIPRLP
jgi:hypothetical protein